MNEVEVNENKPGLMEKIGAGLSGVMKNSELMEQLLPTLLVCLPPPYDIVALIALPIISSALSVKDDPTHLGYQMNTSDKGPEDESFHGSFKEFKDYLDQNFPFDQAKFDQMSPEQQKSCQYAGIAGMMSEIKESAGFCLSPEALSAIARGTKATGVDAEAFCRGLGANLKDWDSLDPIVDAARGTLDPDKFDAVMDVVDAGMREAGSGKGAADFIAAVSEEK